MPGRAEVAGNYEEILEGGMNRLCVFDYDKIDKIVLVFFENRRWFASNVI